MLDVLSEVVEKNALAYPPREGDYTKDGLLYCGKCREARQYLVSTLPGITPFTVFVPCACDRAAKEKAEREHKEALRQWDIRENTRRCFHNAAQRGFTFAADDGQNPELTRLAKGYCGKFEEIRRRDGRRGLLLYGSPGGGKSFIACAICNELLAQGYRCMVTSLPQIVNELQCCHDRNGYIAGLGENDLLVLDDFGVERDTKYMAEQVFTIINGLLLDRVPLIVTTNLTTEQIKNPGEIDTERVISRLYEACFPFEVKTKDRRKAGLRDDYHEMRELLELGDTGAK